MPKTAAKKPAKTKTSPYDARGAPSYSRRMAAYLDAWFEEAPEAPKGAAAEARA